VFEVNDDGQGFKTITWYNGESSYIGRATNQTIFLQAPGYSSAGYVTTATMTTVR